MNINTIATIAADFRKPTKAQAFNHLKTLIDSSPDDVNHTVLADLYSFFMSPIPKKPKSIFHWVAKAKPIKDVRYYLNWVYSDGERLIATDGHRLHIHRDSGLDVGFYDNNELLVHGADYGKFPDIDRVIPKNHLTEIHLSDLEIIDMDGFQAYKINDVYGVRFNYLNDALSYLDNFTMYSHRDDKVYVQSGQFEAVVMGCRL